MGNELAVKEKGIASFLAMPEVRENITNVLGKDHVDSFVSDVVACVQNNETLAKCTNKSIFSAALLSKSINLPLTPQLGYAYLVPTSGRGSFPVCAVVYGLGLVLIAWSYIK